jgi:hypothetical protein
LIGSAILAGIILNYSKSKDHYIWLKEKK